MRRSSIGVGGLATLLFAAQWAPAVAATAAASDEAAPGRGTALQEVVVTARRRAESIEKVPSSVQVVSAAALVQQGIHSEADLQQAAPGLLIRTENTNNLINLSIRGESLDAYSGSAPGVQAYIDEVPISAYTPTTFYDLGGVQVLKGPQGTLFGRNSTGGAVLFTTAQPTNHFGGYASVQYGNLSKLITEGAVNLPIVQDKVLLRLSGTYTSGGAFQHNLYNDQTVGNNSTSGGRATLLLRPVDNITNVTTAELDHSTGTNQYFNVHYVLPCGQQAGSTTCTYTPGNPLFTGLLNGGVFPNYPGGYVFPGGLAAFPAFLQGFPRYTTDSNAASLSNDLNVFVGNTTTWDLSPSITLKNIFGYDYAHSINLYDTDATPYPISNNGGTAPGGAPTEDNRIQVISDEFQVQGKAFGGHLTYIGGFFFDDQKDIFNSAVTGLVNVGLPYLYNYSVRYANAADDKSYALFGQATYAITDRLNLTGGVRYTWDQLSQTQVPGTNYSGSMGPGCPTGLNQACAPGEEHPLSTLEHDESWTVSLDYHLTSHLMAYVTSRGSWRVGGYSPAAPPLGDTITTAVGGNYFLPEQVRDVEAGAKFSGYVAGLPVRANVDVFNAWIYNAQKTAYVVISGTISATNVNVPAAETTGAEGDFQIQPARWLTLGGNVSYDDARFTQPHTTLFGAVATFGPYGDAPRYSGTAFVNISAPLGDSAGTLTWHTDLYAQSSFHVGNFGNTLTPEDKAPGYGVVNMRLDWANPLGAKGLTVSGFVKNLGNKLYFTGGGAGAQDDSLEVFNYGLPRTYGFVLRYSY